MNGDSKNNEKDASKGIDTMQYIVARLISEADDSLEDSRKILKMNSYPEEDR